MHRNETDDVSGRLASIIECADDAILATDLDGIVFAWNPAAERMYGYSADEMLGRSILQTVAPDQRSEVTGMMERIRGGERVEHHETVRIDRHGATIAVSMALSPILSGGQIIGISTICRDIRARLAIEREIRQAHEEEQRLREKLEHISRTALEVTDAVADLPRSDLRAVVQRIVTQAQAVTGAEYAALGIGDDPERPFDPWVQSGVSADQAGGRTPRAVGVLGAVARGKRAIRLRDVREHPEFRGLPPGHPEMTSFLGVPIRYRGENVGNLYLANKRGAPEFEEEDQWVCQLLASRVGSALEIARLYRAEALGKQWLQSVIEAMPEAVIISDPDGRLFYNRAALALAAEDPLGTDRLGDPIRLDVRLPSGDALPWDDLPLFRALREGTSTLGQELAVHARGGRVVPVLANASSVGGQGAVMVLEDITLLRQLERLREEWIALVAHDLRQPISVISLAAQMLRRNVGLTPPQAEVLRRLIGAAERLPRMIDDLLDASRVEARRLNLHRQDLDLAAHLREHVDRLATVLQGHALRLDVRGELRPMRADPGRLEQVLGNLLSNAAKYGEPGAAILVVAEDRGPEAEVSVTNRGAGLEPEELSQVFTRYYRAPSAKAGPQSGLGLGLYITRGLVEAHGGRIWAESTPGETTTFRFTLPYESAE